MGSVVKNPFHDQIRVIQLVEEDLNNVIYRIEKGITLQFRLSPSLHGYKTVLYTNHPVANVDKFTRDKYGKIEWTIDRQNEETFANFRVSLAGSFQYYFTKDGVRSGSGYFIALPVLKILRESRILKLDSICCQTVFAKSLGAFVDWESRLKVSKNSGYNLVHFTPIQKLGGSNSSYSISNQLELNPMFGENVSLADVKVLIDKMRDEWGVLAICDLVLNHTANETPWLATNPEVGYNLQNSSHLRPAYLLDCLLFQMSFDVSQGKYTSRGLPAEISKENHLNALRVILRDDLLPKLKLDELYMINVDEAVIQFEQLLNSSSANSNAQAGEHELMLLQDGNYRRLKSTVDMDLALKIYFYKCSGENDENVRERAKNSFRSKLFQLNDQKRGLILTHLTAAVENVIAGARYERLQSDGPKYAKVSDIHPLIHRYFEKVALPLREELEEEENLTYSERSKFVMVHNGWVMNDDPLRNFAEVGSNVYLRRELIAWTDSVKLRYGSNPDDCPYLWDIMTKYVETAANIFAGIRLDNCHSTPIHAAEYLLDRARNIKPDLYVVAELFTNSDLTDNIFVNRLGITSLIREALSAWDAHEEGRLVFRYGGQPVGAFKKEYVRPLVPCLAHALFMDLTHDNPSPIEKRSVYDVLPTAALVAMASCATGSSRGLDELVPHHIHVVDETRFYNGWSDTEKLTPGYVNDAIALIEAKRVINELHIELGETGFTEVYVDQMEPDIVAVTRHNPDTHDKVVLVSYTAFQNPDIHFKRNGGIKDVIFEGVLEEIVLEARLQPTNSSNSYPKPQKFVNDQVFINGLMEYQAEVRRRLPISNSKFVKLEGNSCVKFVDFQPGSVIAFRITPPISIKQALANLQSLLKKESLCQATTELTLQDLNKVLYRCEQEEQDEFGFGAYNVSNFGSFVYCGLQGINSVMADIRLNNDMGHPICDNLRAGNWLMDYTSGRLLKDEGTRNLGMFLQRCFQNVGEFPRFLVPAYFDLVLRGVYIACIESAWGKMSRFIQSASPFPKSLALGSVQCCGVSRSGPLPFLSPNLADPKPKILKIDNGNVQNCVTLCAGLPHFSTGYMRNWGRDTFISLPGLLLVTGRHQEARYHILAYASILRHGLIPNLLDRGTNSRYNCRDATWFWLESIKKYVQCVPDGAVIFKDRLSRMWPNDFEDAVLDHSVEQSLEEVMQEALTCHFQGVSFRERNAGVKIDAHMKDLGFNVVAGIDKSTGFVYGGNSYNCGTWMDKMGSSEKSGNKGLPATPRDGSAVELVGLCASVIKFLAEMYDAGKYRYNSVERVDGFGKESTWTFIEWYERIKLNFEKQFWINENPGEKVDPQENLINRRGIYKDTVGASAPFCDYQLRPNFLVAMTVAPDLFTPKNALLALSQTRKVLLSVLGMRTLDPSDWNYNGNYDNSNDSSDMKVAHGFNYHNGPEWLWPVGFYLQAYLKMATHLDSTEFQEILKHIKIVMANHWKYLQSSPWKSLPELTNKNGDECWGSCRVQAWSLATLLEVLKDLEELDLKN